MTFTDLIAISGFFIAAVLSAALLVRELRAAKATQCWVLRRNPKPHPKADDRYWVTTGSSVGELWFTQEAMDEARARAERLGRR